MDWTERYARALAEAAGSGGPLDADEARDVLRLAREVAHRTERVNAPLASFLAGRFLAERVRAGASPKDALREAIALAESLLPPATD